MFKMVGGSGGCSGETLLATCTRKKRLQRKMTKDCDWIGVQGNIGMFSERNKPFLNERKNQPVILSLLNGNCEAWDCTVLFYVLLKSGHQLLVPARPKGARSLPLQKSEYVDMLREERNAIAHAKTSKLSDAEFHQRIQNIEMAFSGIGFSTDGLNKMKTATLQTKELKALKDLLRKEEERNEQLEQKVGFISKNQVDLNQRMRILEDRLASKPTYKEAEYDRYGSIPLQVNQFTGRTKDTKDVKEKVANNQLTVITGAPGMGKTCLAIQVGRELVDTNQKLKACFIDLRSCTSIETVTKQILHCFDNKAPEDIPTDQLCKFFCSLRREILLIFDNSEDLLTDDLKHDFLSVTEKILLKCPKLKILCTSRMRFRIPGINCKEHALGPLKVNYALSFLVNNTSNLSIHDARNLAILCGCAPKALEIISYLLEDGGVRPDELIREIDPSVRKPKMDTYHLHSPILDNYQLESCINSSYVRLSPTEQQAFCFLSIFPSTFDLQAACSIIGTIEASQILTSLTVRSLVTYESNSDRYSFHSYIRFFAKSRERFDFKRTIVNFVTHYASVLQKLTAKYYSRDFKAATREIQFENVNIIEMLKLITEESELYEIYKQLADKFVVRFIHAFIPHKEYVSFYRNLLEEAKERDDTKSCSLIYFCLGYYYLATSQYQDAIVMLNDAVLEYGNGNWDKMHIHVCYSWLARCYSSLKTYQNLMRYFPEYFLGSKDFRTEQIKLYHWNAMKYVQRVDDFITEESSINPTCLSMAFVLTKVASAFESLNDLDKSVKLSEEALWYWDNLLGDHLDTARELLNLSNSLYRLRKWDEALQCSVRASGIFLDVIGKNRETASSLYQCGKICLSQRNFRQASNFLRQAVEAQEITFDTLHEIGNESVKYLLEIVDNDNVFQRYLWCFLIILFSTFPRLSDIFSLLLPVFSIILCFLIIIFIVVSVFVLLYLFLRWLNIIVRIALIIASKH